MAPHPGNRVPVAGAATNVFLYQFLILCIIELGSQKHKSVDIIRI